MPRDDNAGTNGSSDSAFPAVAPTSECTWRAFVDDLNDLDLSFRSVVVVSPHPDDETLACGGAMAHLATRGATVQVLAVTDGEASHPLVADLATRRRDEQERALDTLGVSSRPVRFSLPDGRVSQHETELADLIEEHCASADVIFAPWTNDGHADHDACGRAATVAAQRANCRMLAYPVWAWQWATVADLGSLSWRRWELDSDSRSKKAAALRHFGTQITDRLGPPVVDETMLVRFQRPTEVFGCVS